MKDSSINNEYIKQAINSKHAETTFGKNSNGGSKKRKRITSAPVPDGNGKFPSHDVQKSEAAISIGQSDSVAE